MKKDRFSFIRYASCWEDTYALLGAADDLQNKSVLSVCSGGDNTLSLLTKEPKRVVAFDLNPTQLYCLKFKVAAFSALEYEELLALLGVTPCKNRIELFEKLKPKMEDDARIFFEENLDLVRRGIIHTGKFEHYFQLFKKYLLPFICSERKIKEFFSMEDTEEQKAFYEKHINNRRLKAIVKIYFGSQVMGALGRDKSFFDFVEEKKSLSDEVKARFEFAIANTKNRENPYLTYVFTNEYTSAALPHYLKRESYEAIRANLYKLEYARADLFSLNDGGFDFLNLSDIFEYMSHEDFLKSVQKLKLLTRDGARLAYWNMQNKQYIEDSEFLLCRELSKELFRKNNSCFYRDFSVYERKS